MEKPHSYPLFLIATSIFLSGVVQGSGVVTVQLVSYINPGGKAATGDCCDKAFLTCRSRCDHIFNVCLNDPAVSSDNTSCSVGQFRTEVINDENDNLFTDKIGKDDNPFKINFQTWASAIDLKVKVEDDDEEFNTTELVDDLQTSVSIAPSNTVEKILDGRTSLVLKISVSCDENYYGPGCSIFCKPSTGPEGNYDCGPNGDKICKDGWSGVRCDESLDECLSSPCVHGSCQDLANGYKCICEPGFVGVNCHEEADECSSAPCLNGGNCADAFNSYSCSCPGGFLGERCEVRTAPYACASNPCKGGATCQDVGTSFSCTCPAERTGELCETWIPHICDDKPCQHGGKCIRIGHAFKCSCLKGYYDVRCDRKIGYSAKSSKYSAATSTSRSAILILLSLPVLLFMAKN